MSEKFQGKYRNESARLQSWDYGKNASYFVTICTHDREHYFGEIQKHKMHVSPAGAIAHVLWNEIKNHAQHVELGEFVVMPNHIHGILILNGQLPDVGTTPDIGTTTDVGTTPIGGTTPNDGTTHVGTTHALSLPTDENDNPTVGTGHALSLPNAPSLQSEPKTPGQQRFQNPGKNTVSSIIGSFKSAVTKHCNLMQLPFNWQSRFHDHIIRNEESFQRISTYIKNNPSNWEEDRFY